MSIERLEPAARIEVADRVRGGVGLSEGDQLATRAVAEALFATESGPPPAERLDWLVEDLSDFFAHAGTRARFVYRLCLFAIGLLAPLMVRKLPPFRGLSFEDRAHALEALERSPLGLAVFGAKAPLCFVYYEHPQARAVFGQDSSCKAVPS